LFVLTESAADDEIVIEFVSRPGAVGETVMPMATLAFLFNVPRAQVTVPAEGVQVPCEVVTETKVTFGGSASLNATAEALEGPRLVTVIA